MKHHHVITAYSLSLLLLGLTLPTGVFAKPKGTPGSCTTKDLNTTFGASCNDQMQDDIMKNKPYTHVLYCGGGTMLCCTVDNATGQVQTCRKPAGTRVMPDLQGTFTRPSETAGVQRRGVDDAGPADEEAPVPSSLTPDVAKRLLKDHNTK